MAHPSLKTAFLALAFTGFVLSGPAHAAAPAAAPAASLAKADIEKIVEEYILAHPEVILKSVDEYQQKSMQTRQTDAVKNNATSLFEDETAPFIGNPKGDVVMVEFFDYNCGYCKKAYTELKALVAADKNLKVIMKDFPILGPTSETAAQWAIAAQKQGKYEAFHEKMMDNKMRITDDLLARVAKEAGLDVAQAKADAESTDTLIQIEKNRTLASQMGLSGTPAFIVGDAVVPGAASAEQLRMKIEEVRKAKQLKK